LDILAKMLCVKDLKLDQPVAPPIVLCQAILKGLQSLSPGLRAASYPGLDDPKKVSSTLKGLNPFQKCRSASP
jgi:hypothetical protein